MNDIPIGEIHLECPHCGATDQFVIPEDSTVDSEIVCKACGHAVCTIGEFNTEVIRKGKAMLPEVADVLRRHLK